MTHEYHTPGEYIAICRNDENDPAFAFAFVLPTTITQSAREYFQQHIDKRNTVEAVYPLAVFTQMQFAARKSEELHARLREEDKLLALVQDALTARRSFIAGNAEAMATHNEAYTRFKEMRESIRRQMRAEGLCG